jgi:hypothetical protein
MLYDIPNFSDYQITRDGRVWSKERYVVCHNGRKYLYKGRWLKQGFDKDGYLVVAISNKEYVNCYAVHVLVCLAFHGPKPFPKAQVRHLDGNTENLDPKNLCWGTHQENMEDRKLHGRTCKGSKIGLSKLDESSALIVKWLLDFKYCRKEIAELFGVSYYCICDIATERTWAHIS